MQQRKKHYCPVCRNIPFNKEKKEKGREGHTDDFIFHFVFDVTKCNLIIYFLRKLFQSTRL